MDTIETHYGQFDTLADRLMEQARDPAMADRMASTAFMLTQSRYANLLNSVSIFAMVASAYGQSFA